MCCDVTGRDPPVRTRKEQVPAPREGPGSPWVEVTSGSPSTWVTWAVCVRAL